jgi:hypothetical protein
MTDLPAQPTKSRKGLALAAGGAVLAAAAIGGGVWGYQAYFGQGEQPAQALPAKGLLGYVALDLSPNGDQLLAARSTLKKFPGLADQVKLDGKEDLRKTLFEKLQQDGTCKGLDYDKQVAPWLGDRVGVAAMDAGKGEEPEGLLVLQTTDTGKAEKALPAVLDCLNEDSSAGSGLTSHAFSGSWLVLGEAKGSAEKAVKAAEDASLADDEQFATWTDAAGEPGILTAYGSKLGYQRIATFFQADSDIKLPKAAQDQMDKFTGAGLVGRFRDGGLEVEFASNAGDDAATLGDAVGSLPASTVAALGFAVPDGWLDKALDTYGPLLEDEAGMSRAELERELTAMTGLGLKDVEDLVGDSVVISVDSDIDTDAVKQFDPSGVPIGLTITGDTAKVQKAIDKLRDAGAKQGMPRGFVVSKVSGDHVVVSVSPQYADTLADKHGLAKSETFAKLVPNADDAASAFFLDFDANGWLDDLMKSFEAPQDVRDNVAPLRGIGVTGWVDGDVAHGLLKVATD